ncbi:DUF6968 family protein [Brevundimonas sp.]|uniref:DUF6968 family protein n=1 Tax=Brevundimonas sp. TaxID=1871086 RepID=UPI002FC68672
MTDDVVCEREFNTVIDGEVVPILVQWMKPTHEGLHWRCDYSIAWPDRPVRRFHAMGVDSAQALILALYMVRAELETAPSPVRWFDNEADLGLPAFEATGERDPG